MLSAMTDDAPESLQPHIGGALDPINDAFHDEYARARDGVGLEAPVLVLLGDELTLVRDAQRRQTLAFTPRVFHALKSIAHLPVAVFAVLERAEDVGDALAELGRMVARAEGSLADDVPDAAAQRTCRTMLTATARLLRSRSPRDELGAYARAMGEHVMVIADLATRELLGALHAAFGELLAPLEPELRASLHVVVAGAHQARARNLPLQYFQRVLGEPRGHERRVTFAEAVQSVDAALTLVGTQRLDRKMAEAFFGDPQRLQRDILGDAAQHILETAELDDLPEGSLSRRGSETPRSAPRRPRTR